jgi:hypothetical protein
MWNIWKKRCHKVFHKWGLQHRQLQELIRQDLQQWQAAGRRHWGAPDCNHVSLTAYETCLGYRALVSSTGLVVLFYFLFLLFWLLYICSFFYLMQSPEQPPNFLKKWLLYTSIRSLSTINLFKVNVPVLSLQRSSMTAISLIAVILFVIAPYNNTQHFLHHPAQISGKQSSTGFVDVHAC